MEKATHTPLPACDVPAIWMEHKKELFNFIQKRVKDKELSEDILQEVLLKVYKWCNSNSGVRNIRSWLFQIAQNTIIDHFRKSSKLVHQELPDMAAEDENVAFKEAVNFIEPMLGFLPEEYAIPLRMADIEGMKQANIAQQLGLSLPATKSRIQRARNLLKAEFITCCNFETDARGNLVHFDIKASCTPLISYRQKNS